METKRKKLGTREHEIYCGTKEQRVRIKNILRHLQSSFMLFADQSAGGGGRVDTKTITEQPLQPHTKL